MKRRASPVEKMNVFHLLLFKHHRLLLSGMLLLSFYPVSIANPTGQECHEEELGVWTGDISYKSGMNVSIGDSGGQDSWGSVVLRLQEKREFKAKVLLRRNGDNLIVDGIGITFSETEIPHGFLWNSDRLTMNFEMTKRVNKMIMWNDTSSFTLGFNSINANIDSLRIYSNKTLSTYSKTAISICNSDTVTGTGQERGTPKTESPPDAMTECPTCEPCPTPEEKICPLCPETSCPSAPPCPTTTVPCPPITTTYQEKPDDNENLHDHIRNNTLHQNEVSFQTVIFLEGWDRWIMYGLAAGCTAFLLVSVALAIALCKVRRRCAKMVKDHTSVNSPLQLDQSMDWNNLDKVSGTPVGLMTDTNKQPSHNLHIPGNQPPNTETADDHDDFDSDPEEWNNQDPIYANCVYFDENLPPAHND